MWKHFSWKWYECVTLQTLQEFWFKAEKDLYYEFILHFSNCSLNRIQNSGWSLGADKYFVWKHLKRTSHSNGDRPSVHLKNFIMALSKPRCKRGEAFRGLWALWSCTLNVHMSRGTLGFSTRVWKRKNPGRRMKSCDLSVFSFYPWDGKVGVNSWSRCYDVISRWVVEDDNVDTCCAHKPTGWQSVRSRVSIKRRLSYVTSLKLQPKKHSMSVVHIFLDAQFRV